jgi:hopanoid biosynthesis associated radical SAM protein HpnH
LRKNLSVEKCLAASDECGAPMVSIAGGEPLLHPEMPQIVRGLIDRGRYIYLCTNALLLKQKLDEYTPDKHLSFSIHMDGPRTEHNFSVAREGVYDTAVEAIQEAVRRGFRVTTNTTLFDGANPERMRKFFDDMMELGVEGMMISPGYSYEKAPDQEHFLRRERSQRLFAKMLENPHKQWRFNQSPLFLQFLMGKRDFECTPWGNPTYNIFGWQRPCYLLQDGYVKTFRELMEETEWDNYGRKSGNPRCQDCMVHCGFEPSAVNATFGSARAMGATVASMVTGQL